MRKVLYLLTKNPPAGMDSLLPQRSPSETDVSVILLQDAVSRRELFGTFTYVLADDVRARKVESPFPHVSYREMLQMIFSADCVIAA
ncbi:MAG: hypothetical protein ACREIS_11840 [Nitrospiraceae bacterium]